MSESAELTQVSATGILGGRAFEPWRKEERERESSEQRDSQPCEDQSICRHLMPNWKGYTFHSNLVIKKIFLCYKSGINTIEVILECDGLMRSLSHNQHLASSRAHFTIWSKRQVNRSTEFACPSMLRWHTTALLPFNYSKTIPHM